MHMKSAEAETVGHAPVRGKKLSEWHHINIEIETVLMDILEKRPFYPVGSQSFSNLPSQMLTLASDCGI